jgi:uncharacterized protein (TIRG00374 family)
MAADKWFPLRAAICFGLLLTLIWTVEWSSFARAMSEADAKWIIAAIVAFVFSQICGAVRWRTIATALGAMPAGVSCSFAISVTFSALWYSNFLPSAFGGDVVRVLRTWRSGGRLVRSISASILDRYFGLAGLLVFLALCLPLVDGHNELRLLLCITITIFFLASTALIRIHWLPSIVGIKLRRTFRLFAITIRFMIAKRAVLSGQLALTALGTLISLFGYWCAVRATGVAPDSASTLVVAACTAILASILPISLAGWGVREGTLAALLHQLCGLDPLQASLATVINAIAIISGGLIGWILDIYQDIVGIPDTHARLSHLSVKDKSGHLDEVQR